MPNKSHSNASQLRIFKARDIAYDIVKTKADLLVALYCDRKQPKTHTDIWKQLVLPDYPDVSLDKMSTIISIAIREVFNDKEYKKLRKWRKNYFDALHGEVVWHKNLEKFLAKARSCWDTSTWWAKRQAEMAERWLHPWYGNEISYLCQLLTYKKYQRTYPPYKWSPNYSLIADRLNKKFHYNQPVRVWESVRSYVHKHKLLK